MTVTSDLRRLGGCAALVVAALLGPSLGAAQELRSPPKAPRSRIVAPYLRAGALRALPRVTLGTVTESEPNGTIPSADSVAFGDTISAVVDPAGDQDFFGLDLTAGTMLQLDVDAELIGSPLDPILALFDAGGIQLAFNDDRDGLDSRIEFTITTTARYYVGVAGYGGSGGPGYLYTLMVTTFVPPPPAPVIPPRCSRRASARRTA